MRSFITRSRNKKKKCKIFFKCGDQHLRKNYSHDAPFCLCAAITSSASVPSLCNVYHGSVRFISDSFPHSVHRKNEVFVEECCTFIAETHSARISLSPSLYRLTQSCEGMASRYYLHHLRSCAMVAHGSRGANKHISFRMQYTEYDSCRMSYTEYNRFKNRLIDVSKVLL